MQKVVVKYPQTSGKRGLVYDGYLCIQRLNAAANNAIDLIFAWDPAEPVATRPLMIEKPGKCMLHVTHDGNKNVSDLVFFSGGSGVAAHYEYAPFGALAASTRNSTSTAYDFRIYNHFRFSSEYADDALGLVYYNYRHYEPVMGRWITRDPIGELGGEHLYAFCLNVVFSIDVLGLKDECGRAGMFDLIDISVGIARQDRLFSEEQILSDMTEFLKTLKGVGMSAIGGVASASSTKSGKLLSAIMSLLKQADQRLSKKDKERIEELKARYLKDGIYRIDGVIKFKICECQAGHLKWKMYEEKIEQNVDFSICYDEKSYGDEIRKTYKSVEGDLLEKMRNAMNEAKENARAGASK